MPDFDVVILGAGSAGYSCALRAAQLGLSVALVDDTPVGGTCLHRGCIPTKAWLHAAEVRRTVVTAAAFGIAATLEGADAAGVRGYADSVVDQLHRGLRGLLAGRGVTTVAARGRLVTDGAGPAILADGELYRGGAVVIATGASPITLGLGIDGKRLLTSEDALRLDTLPRRAIVLGGGVIGVEFASLWRDLGVEVVLVEAAERLLLGEEPGHSRILTKELRARGVDVRLGAALEDVTATDDAVTARLGDETLTADVLLVAVGRRPATQGLGLEDAGITLGDSGHIQVDERLRTSARGVWAAGDVVAGPQLAHRGYAHGIFLAEQIAHLRGRLPVRPTLPADRDMPRITYSSPQLASVGLTAAEAGQDAQVVDYRLGGNGRALLLRCPGERESGVVRLVRRPDGPIVGVHLIGDNVAELVAEGALLVGWQATPDDVAGIVHAHPTLGESIAEANWALAGRGLHTPA